MRIESASKGLAELNNENPLNKMGKYSFKNIKQKADTGKPRSCYYCGQDIKTSVIAHVKSCKPEPANAISVLQSATMKLYVGRRKQSINWKTTANHKSIKSKFMNTATSTTSTSLE